MIQLSVVLSEFPLHLLVRAKDRLWSRDESAPGEPELLFSWGEPAPLLPVRHKGQFKLIPWGNRSRRGRLPLCGWTWADSIRQSKWSFARFELVTIPANLVSINGVWTATAAGLRGLVAEQDGELTGYVVCTPTQRYYRTFFGQSEWMPLMLGMPEDDWRERIAII